MKKLIFVLLISLFTFNAKGNIAEYRPFIYEFHLDEEGFWHLELGYLWWNYPGGWLYEMLLESSSHSFCFYEGMGVSFGYCDYFDYMERFSQSSFNLPEFFNPAGDFIRFTSYSTSGEFETIITFGNYPNADYPCFGVGQSLIEPDVWIPGYHISNSPSIGFCNDYNNIYGYFSGLVLDPEGYPFTNGSFLLEGFYQHIQLNPDGSFWHTVISGSYSFDEISVYSSSNPNSPLVYAIEPFTLCLCNDSTFHRIIKTTELLTSINQPVDHFEKSVTVSPNPFTDAVTFYFNFENIAPDDELNLHIFGSGGALIEKTRLSYRQTGYVWRPSQAVKPGMLTYHLTRNNEVIKSGKLVKL